MRPCDNMGKRHERHESRVRRSFESRERNFLLQNRYGSFASYAKLPYYMKTIVILVATMGSLK